MIQKFLEGIFWDLLELHCHGLFDGIVVRKMGSLQNRFDLGEEKKVTSGQIIVLGIFVVLGIWRESLEPFSHTICAFSSFQ